MNVSIIIVNFNTFALTCDCIKSVLHYSQGFEFEIILIDNNSTDVHAEKFSEVFPQVILVKNQVNLGFAKANNQGIAIAKGKYCLLLNSDTLFTENSVLPGLRLMENDRTIGIAGCKLQFPDGKVQHNVQRFPDIRYIIFELLRLQKILPRRLAGKFLLGPFFDYNALVKADWLWGTFLLIRRELIEKLPGKKLDDDLFMYGEDMQWCLDASKLGYNIVYFPDTTVIHLMGASNGQKEEWMSENLDKFLVRNYSALHVWLLKFLTRLLNLSIRRK